MNASSQTSPGAETPEPTHGPRQLPGPATSTDAFAAYGAVLPVPAWSAAVQQAPTAAPVSPGVPAHLVVAGTPEPAVAECVTCGTNQSALVPCPQGRRYPSGARVLYCRTHSPLTSVVQAASGVMTAAMEHGHSTAQELAQAEEDAGLLVDPQRMKDLAQAAIEQARVEFQADLGLAEEARDWCHDRYQAIHAPWQAVQALVAGRPEGDLMLVSEILKACDPKRQPGAPLAVTWDGLVMGPSGDTPNENTLVPCTTPHGTPAVLVLDDDRRLQLGELLLSTVHTAETCHTPGCGTAAGEVDATNPFITGWICIEVAGTDGGPRWWCNAWCANAAITAGGAELAAADQTAATDPAQQAPRPLHYAVTYVDQDDDARCVRCGCTENTPCKGGCAWMPNQQMTDLCSACATPAELAAAQTVYAPVVSFVRPQDSDAAGGVV